MEKLRPNYFHFEPCSIRPSPVQGLSLACVGKVEKKPVWLEITEDGKVAETRSGRRQKRRPASGRLSTLGAAMTLESPSLKHLWTTGLKMLKAAPRPQPDKVIKRSQR